MPNSPDPFSVGHAVVKRLRLNNVMGSPLAVVALVTLPSLIAYGWSGSWPLLILAAAPVVLYVVAFIYFMINDPQMLRTEEHEERMLQISAGLGYSNHEFTEEDIDAMPSKEYQGAIESGSDK